MTGACLRLVGLVGAVALAACGRLSFDVVANAGDDAAPGSDSSTNPDAFVEGCWPYWRSQSLDVQDPVLISELNTDGNDDDPVLSANGLRLYFSSDGAGAGLDFYVASRPSVGAPFGTAVLTPGLSSPAEDGKQWISADELTAVIATQRAGGTGSWDLWAGARDSIVDAFTLTQNGFFNVNTVDGEDDPYLTPDGLELFYASDTGGSHVMHATRTVNNRTFGSPSEVTHLSENNTLPTDAMLSPDGLVVLFTSHSASADLYYATRSSKAVDFGAIVEIPNVNTPKAEFDVSVSYDGCELFFASDTGAATDFEMYRALVIP